MKLKTRPSPQSTSATLVATIKLASWISVTARIRAFLSISAAAPKPTPILARASFRASGASVVLRYGKGFWGDTLYRVFYGEGIKEPRFDQIFGDNFGDFGNPSLKPESSKTWTTGIEQKLLEDRIHFSAEYFSSRFYDIVSFEFCTPANNNCDLTLPGSPSFLDIF